MSGTDEKNDEGMGAEESETIALSSNELDDILSEAEIVQEASKTVDNPAAEDSTESKEEFDIPLTEEEFDISDEIDQLTPEDLENIELEESEIESFSKELEEELGEEIALPEGLPQEEAVVVSPEEISEELEGIDTEEISLEPTLEGDDIDLESLDSVDAGAIDLESLENVDGGAIDLESLESIESGDVDLGSLEGVEPDSVDLGDLDLGEELGEPELSEPPVLGDEPVDMGIESGDAFKEAGIEGIDDESVTLADVDLEGIEDITVEAEIPSMGEEAGEVTLEDLGEEELPDIEAGAEAVEEITGEETVEELPADEFIEELPSDISLDETEAPSLVEEEPAPAMEATEPVVEELPDDGFADEIMLGEDEEKILSEDFDLSTEVEELPEEDVVTISGDEVGTLGDVGSVDAALLNDITTILKFMDTLLGDLPDEKIKEFAQSEYFPLYKEVFEKLNLA